MLNKTMIVILLGMSLVVQPSAARAESPDFSDCDGMTGAAWGLCRAGVAAGCADGTGNSKACRQIEDTYTDVTGEPFPWNAPPPPTCPCDYSAIAKANPPWSPGVSEPIRFTCPLTVDGGRDVEIYDYLSAEVDDTRVVFYYVVDSYHVCESRVDGVTVNDHVGMSEPVQAVCQADAIAYGQALKLALGSDVDDACTPILP